MLWCCFCTWPQYSARLAERTLPRGYRLDAVVTDWYLLRLDSSSFSMAIRDDGRGAFRERSSRGILFWTYKRDELHETSHLDPMPQRGDDGDCTETRRSIGGSDPPEMASRTRIAGYESVQYRWSSNDREEVVAFAPALGCQMMLLREIHYGRLGLPIGISEFRVTSIRRAGREPDLFEDKPK